MTTSLTGFEGPLSLQFIPLRTVRTHDKIAATRLLLKLGLPTPPAFTITRSELPLLWKRLRQYPEVDFWHLRSNPKEEGNLRKKVAGTDDLADVLSEAFMSFPDARIIVQQRVDTIMSGVAATTANGIYVEYVVGGLKSLLRDGVTPARLLLGLNGRLLAHRNSIQEFWYKWENEVLIKNPRVEVPPLGRRERQILLRGTRKLEKVAVYEWVQDSQGRMFFLDFKLMPFGFLRDKRNILDGIESGFLRTLNTPIQGKVIYATTERPWKGVFLLNSPLHEFVDSVICRATGVVCRLGGLLSHLIVYASKANIPCMISPVHYERFRKAKQCMLLLANIL